ncbi:DUF11 domain-containing protein [Variovorax sp. PCZ-1]|uniref:DUF11 domain-containing protein n=1 Tax=Variovorax sp. PCZ-1 TaxID=2835533 RepID=UPI001BCDD43F|nr:DUF11 domain-containing protein [Variovorax sp. PCZ-1]MBS7808708.1 hypothetical protein [Variovorax sp. PCZ-1]
MFAVLASMALLGAHSAQAQVSTTNAGAAFACDANFYQTRAGGGSTALLRFPSSALSTGGSAQSVFGSSLIPVDLNAIGFRRQDGFMYALQQATQQPKIYRVGQGGVQLVGTVVTSAGQSPALSSSFVPTAGVFDTQGRYYILGQGAAGIVPQAIYRIDNLVPDGSGNIQVSQVYPLNIPVVNPGDVSFAPDGNLYAATGNSIIQIALTPANTAVATVRTLPSSVGGVGSAFLNDAGDLFVFSNGDGKLSKVNFSFGAAFPTGPLSISAAALSTAGLTLPSSVAASDGANCVNVDADMVAQPPVLPAVVSPGSTITTNAVCVNNGPAGATAPTCAITSNIPGAVVTVGTCTPPLPVEALRASAGNNTISCPVTIQVPGTLGGTDIPLSSGSFTVTAGSSSPDPTPSNNQASKTFTVIDAVNDPLQTVAQGQAVTFPVLGNDTVGNQPATAANVTVTLLSSPGLSGTNAPTVDSSGNITIPSTAPAGNYTLTYQICAVPTQSPPACDTATKPITITPQPVVDTRKSAGTPQDLGNGRFAVPYSVSVGNNGATPLPNVQAVDNLRRSFPGASTVTVGPVTTTGVNGATCTPASPAFTGQGTNTKLLSGSNTLTQGQRCDFAFVVTVDYGGVAAIPTTAQKNSVYASGSSNPANPGPTVADNPSTPVTTASYPAGTLARDESTDKTVNPPGAPGVLPPAPGLPSTPGSDFADPTPVSFAPQLLDVLKSASIPVQLDISGKRFRVAYAVTIANTGSTNATNVQAGENLKFTFPAPASFTVSGTQIMAGSSAATCASNLNTQFDGGTAYTGSNAENYNLFRSSASLADKASNMTLAPGQFCQVSFVVDVDYGTAVVPNGGLNAQNRVFGQTAASPNKGATFDPSTGVKTGDAPDLINKDTSEAVAPTTPTYGGTPPAPPAAPTTPKQNPGSSTSANFATLETVKKLSAAPVRTGASTFQVAYEVTVQAVGNNTRVLNQVQAVDSLRATYSSGNPTVTVAGLAGAPISGATCSVNNTFNGDSDIRLLAGTDDWTLGQGCTLRFTATLAYPNVAAIPTTAQQNSVYASSISDRTNANTPNNGGTINPSNGNWTEPTPPAGQQVIAKDKSTDGAPIPPSPGLDTPSPTPVDLSAIPQVPADMRVAVNGLPTSSAPGAVVTGTLVCTNAGPSEAVAVSCNANVGSGASIVVGACVASSGSTSILPVGATLSCPIQVTLPGTPGGVDTTAQDIIVSGVTAASNDSNPANNNAQAPISIIDAIDDPAQTIPQGQAATLNVLGNDGAGVPVASAANVTVTLVSGAPAGTTVDSNGNLIVPASAPAGSYTITYRICAAPATTPAACDTATKPLTISPLPVIDTRKSAGTPQDLGLGRFLVPYAISVGNNGATPVPNVQAIENLQRTFPGATIVAGPVTITPVGGASCSPAATTFNGIGNNALLSGSNTLNQGQRCDFTFTTTVDFGSLAAVPTTAQKNSVYASGSSTPSNPGHTVPNSGPVTSPTNAVTVDESTDRTVTPPGAPGVLPPVPGIPGTPGSDAADPTPVLFVAQTLDVLKAASRPIQLDTSGKRFRVAYAITVANTGATVATNVQAGENLKFTFPAPASFVVSNVALGAGSAATCAPNLNAQFDGGAGYNSAADAKNYNLFRNSADASNKASNMNLAAGTACQVSFTVDVDYGSAVVPNAAAGAQNRVFGQTAASPNEGATFDPATGTKTGDAPDLINKDTSEGVVTTTTYGGTPPAFPGIPTTPKASPGSSTEAKFATLEVVKRVAGTIVRSGPSTFQVPYEVTVQAVGNAGVTLTQVQSVDSLRAAFAAGNPSISVTPALSAASGSAIGAATCSVNAGFNGVGDIRLLAGTDDWVVGQGCTIRFTATVAYAAVADIPSAAQENSVYASSVSDLANANTPNDGGAVNPATGVWTPPTPPAGQQVIAKDRSTDAAPVPPSSALDTPRPTPALLIAPPTIVGIKYAELPNSLGGGAIPGDTVRWTIIYKNTSSQVATNVRITDVLDTSLSNPVIVSVTPAGFTANPAYTGIAPNTELLNTGGTLGAGAVLRIVVETQIRATPTVAQVTNGAVLRADELGGSAPGAITVPTSAAGPTLPPCPAATACNPDPASITIPPTAIGGQPTSVGGNTVVPLVAPGGISGRVWIDGNGNGQLDGGEPTLGGYRVAVYAVDPTTGARLREVTSPTTRPATLPNGSYNVTGLAPTGPNLTYDVVFFNENGDAIMGVPRGNNTNTAINGAPNNLRNALTNVRVLPGVVTTLQDLPLDPSGVVYDSNTRAPIPGATVQLLRIVGGAATSVPASDLVGGANTVVTGASGVYQFILNAGAPAGEYEVRVISAPSGYNTQSTQIPPSPSPVTPGAGAVCPGQVAGQQCQIQPQGTAPLVGQATTYFLRFNLTPGVSPDVVHNHIPLDAGTPAVLVVTKVANKASVELGDTLLYKVRVKYVAGGANLTTLSITDNLPAGFRLIASTAQISAPASATPVNLAAASIVGAPGASVTFNLTGALPAGGLPVAGEVELSYRVRVGVGSLQGDGINKAQAFGNGQRSNVAQAKVKVTGGVFANEGCIVGKIYVDCNNNHMQDAEELGVPNVRLYLNDGTYMVSDSEGKYSICGIEPKSWVLKVDQLTLPRGSRLTTSSNRNLGNADSLWVDLKNGEMHQADFIIGSCSNTVMEQVKSRRSQGGVSSVGTERQGGPALKWEGKAPGFPDQGTDSANQPLMQPRPSGPPRPSTASSDAENNTPVPQLPASSGSTRGNNLRDVK